MNYDTFKTNNPPIMDSRGERERENMKNGSDGDPQSGDRMSNDIQLTV